MKKLLYITFIITSLNGFSQEKKGICSSGFHLFHESGDDSIPDDHFNLKGFSLSNPLYYGGFHIDSTIYEVTLPFGDSLLYSAYWQADGMCETLMGSEIVDSIITILEGVPFPIIHEGYYGGFSYFSLSQKAVIRNPCLFKIQKNIPGANSYFIRVKFQDPPIPEAPLDLPEITNDYSIWLSNENMLSIKADENSLLDIHLYSLSGELVQEATIEGSQNLEISTLPKGCYIVHSSDKNGLEKRLKFVK